MLCKFCSVISDIVIPVVYTQVYTSFYVTGSLRRNILGHLNNKNPWPRRDIKFFSVSISNNDATWALVPKRESISLEESRRLDLEVSQFDVYRNNITDV